MNAYPKYKESGIDWLGKIPSHWALSKIKYSFENLDNLREPIASENRERRNPKYDYYGASGVIDKVDGYNVDDTVLLIAEDGANLVMRNLPLIYKASGKIWVNNHAHILKPLQDVDYEYMYYYLESIDYNDFITGSAQPKLSQGNLANVDVLRPTLSEQKAIAVYLDEKTGKIDKLMAEKTKQVEDLRSYRTSVITEAVTRGLNPDAPLRQSGIDWIGEIPEDWKVLPLKYLLKTPLMYGANETPEEDTVYGHPRYIRITDISEGGGLKPETYRTLDPQKAMPYLLKYGDILFARSGATVGKTYRFKEKYDACFAGYLIKASCGDNLSSEYLFYYTNTQCYNNWKNSIFDQSTIQNIAADKYNILPVPVPPLSEQQEIAAYLDEKTAKIDKLIGELNAQLTELADYKQAVISEAVTGKVDVRNYRI